MKVFMLLWFLWAGWAFSNEPGCTPDPLYSSTHIRDLYFRAEPTYSGKNSLLFSFLGRFTVPVLWDSELHTIVNNESSEIIRQFNSAFDEWSTKPGLTYYPEPLRSQIDEVNVWIYDGINNGVYKTGFATAQDACIITLFNYKDRWKELSCLVWFVGPCWRDPEQEPVLGEWGVHWGWHSTLHDHREVKMINSFTFRFDPVYFGHFKCNLKPIKDFPAIMRWLKEVYHMPGIAETVNMEHIKVKERVMFDW